MTHEAVAVEGPYEVHDFDVTPNTAIDKYTLCYLSGDRLAAPSSGDQVFAGIAASDKSVSDGDVSTDLGLFTTGTFDLYSDTTIALGVVVALSGTNIIRTALAADLLSGKAFGRTQEAITAGASGEVKLGGHI